MANNPNRVAAPLKSNIILLQPFKSLSPGAAAEPCGARNAFRLPGFANNARGFAGVIGWNTPILFNRGIMNPGVWVKGNNGGREASTHE